MNSVKNMPFRWSINPYRGCSHGCSFCYARPTHAFLGMDTDDTFRSEILVKSNAKDALERQLEALLKKNGWNVERLVEKLESVAIGTATDPYQPVEGKTGLTRSLLEVLAQYRVPVSITTRSPLILRDVDLLKSMNVTSINISVNTLNPVVWRGLEPASPPPIKRMEALSALREEGIPAGIFLAPIIPDLTDSTKETERILKSAKQSDALFVVPSLLRLSDEVKGWFFEWIKQDFPTAERTLRRLYTGQMPSRAYMEWKMSRIRLLIERNGLASSIDTDHAYNGSPSTRGSQLKPIREQMTLPI